MLNWSCSLFSILDVDLNPVVCVGATLGSASCISNDGSTGGTNRFILFHGSVHCVCVIIRASFLNSWIFSVKTKLLIRQLAAAELSRFTFSCKVVSETRQHVNGGMWARGSWWSIQLIESQADSARTGFYFGADRGEIFCQLPRQAWNDLRTSCLQSWASSHVDTNHVVREPIFIVAFVDERVMEAFLYEVFYHWILCGTQCEAGFCSLITPCVF